MKGIYLTMQEETKYQLVKSFVDNQSTNFKNLALKLNASLKTAYNLVRKYKDEGKAGFIHKNHFHKPVHTMNESIKNDIVSLYETLGHDINFTHFKDILKRDYNISVSRSFIHNLLRSNNLYSPKSRRATIKKRNQMIKNKLKHKDKLTSSEQSIVADHLLHSYHAHPRKSRSKYFGELLQMDASQHVWFGSTKYHLHVAIDDSNGKIVGAYFNKQETLFAYYQITKQFLLEYGIPVQILTDNRTIFNSIYHNKSSEERDTFTQYGFMCHRLGIALATSSVPQVKGRVERLFQTLQSRLPVELRLNHISSVDEANLFLTSYIKEFNQQFALPYNLSTDAFEKIDIDIMNETLAVVSRRIADNGGCIKYNNHYYHFFDHNGNRVSPLPKTKCLVIKKLDDSLVAIIDDSHYSLEIHQTHRKDSILERPLKKEKKIYRPPLSHPYKQQSYLNYLKNIRPKQQNNYSHEYR